MKKTSWFLLLLAFSSVVRYCSSRATVWYGSRAPLLRMGHAWIVQEAPNLVKEPPVLKKQMLKATSEQLH